MAGGGHLRAHAIIFFTTFLVGVCDTVVYPRAKLRVKRIRLSPGMAIPLKTISTAFWVGGLIFGGLREL